MVAALSLSFSVATLVPPSFLGRGAATLEVELLLISFMGGGAATITAGTLALYMPRTLLKRAYRGGGRYL